MANELAIIKQENISTIVQAAPQSYQDNKMSCEKCVDAGQAILNSISQQGVTAELDQLAAAYIEKARKTIKKMNERRSPVTKLFDDIRKEFTALENTVDPTKADTLPYKLQQYRNQYAAKQRAAEEQRRRELLAKQQAEQVRLQLRQNIEDDLKVQFQTYLDIALNNLTSIDSEITLDNYAESCAAINDFSVELPDEWIANMRTQIGKPSGIEVAEFKSTEDEKRDSLKKQFADQYTFEVQSNKEYILDRLPSKKVNLERIAQADAAEAGRIKAHMAEREREEAAQKEKERIAREMEAKQKAEAERQAAEMNNLFAAQATTAEYQPKSKVSKKIEVLNPEGILPIITMWWSKEGCTMSVDELCKLFKKQLTFCEKLADKDGVLIEDESLQYIDDVKAK